MDQSSSNQENLPVWSEKYRSTSQEKMDLIIERLKNTHLNDTETLDIALNNLIVLARDTCPEVVFEHPDCLAIISENIDNNRGEDTGTQIIISCFRLLSELCRMSVDRTKAILKQTPIDYLTDVICYTSNEDVMSSYQYLIQTIINSLAGVQEMINKRKNQAKLDKKRTLCVGEAICSRVQKKVDDDFVKANESILYDIIRRIIKRADSFIISTTSRDCLLGLAMNNIDYQGLNFGVKLVQDGCIQSLLDIASEVDDIKNLSSMDISPVTHSLVAGVLEKMYSCHDHDKVRETYREVAQEYLILKMRGNELIDQIRALKILTVLLAGPAEVGNSCVGQPGVIEAILEMASSDHYVSQKAALDTIIAAASKKDKCNAIAKLGEKVLHELKESNNEEIRLRALVGLSKVSSVGSTDASIRPFSPQANPAFARECMTILKRRTPEFNLKTYAIEALAYLSFDGEVKEELVKDDQALEVLFDMLSFDVNSPVAYPTLTIFVNLTNSYDKQEYPPELVELARFAQQHVPQEHPKDAREFLEARLRKLAYSELVPSMIEISETESRAAKELMSRILNALCEIVDVRGHLVQQGAVKLLIILSQSILPRPERCCLLASQALARLSITLQPDLVLPGQRLITVIRPLKKLLSPDCSALENFEALLALTNIAQADDSAREHILNENGFSLIEALMFEDHELVKRAAVQCVVNLISDPEVIALYNGDNDRVKYLVILCHEEDIETVKAASGALAMLCQASPKACEKIFTAKDWFEVLMYLLTHDNMELVHRASVIINCIVCCENTQLAQMIFDSKILEVIVAISLPQMIAVPESVKNFAKSILKLGIQRNLIKDISALSHINVDDTDS